MLENLDNVPWSALTHASGSAEDVPVQLRALLSSDPDVRDKARWSLRGTLVQPGARFPASAPAVPFLLEAAADPATGDRAQLLELLTALAVGHDATWLPGGVPQAADEARGWGPAEQAAHRAVGEGLPLFLKLLRDDDAAVRRAAAGLLAWFPTQAAATVGELTWAALDPDPSVVATALIALGLVGGDRPLATETATAAFTDPGPPAALTDPGRPAAVTDAGRPAALTDAAPQAALTDAGPQAALTDAGPPVAEPGGSRDVVSPVAESGAPADVRSAAGPVDDRPSAAETATVVSAEDRHLVRGAAAIALAALRGRYAGRDVTEELQRWSAGTADARTEVPFLDGDLHGYATLALRQVMADKD